MPSKQEHEECCTEVHAQHPVQAATAGDHGGRRWTLRGRTNRKSAKNCTHAKRTARMHIRSRQKPSKQEQSQGSKFQQFAGLRRTQAARAAHNPGGVQSAVHLATHCPSKTRAREQRRGTHDACAQIALQNCLKQMRRVKQTNRGAEIRGA